METYLLVGSELLSSMSPVAIPPQSLGGKLSWMNPVTNLEKIERYLGSIEDGNFAYIADLFSPYAVIEQLPNRIYPNGIRTGVATMADSFEKGRKLLSSRAMRSKIASSNWQSPLAA
jgi:hypothetical protein